jgi:hypothetical protein
MLYRRITVILLVLFTLLSGCSKKAKSEMKTPQKSKEVLSVQTGEKTEQQDGEKDNPVSYESESESIVPENDAAEAEENAPENGKVETEEDTPENNVIETEGKKNGDGNEKNNIIELIPMAQLPELNMDSQTPYTIDDIISVGTSMLTPVYHDTFRYQIREFTKNPARLVIDIGNTGDETFVITDENMQFSILDSEGNDVAGSKVQDAPVSIAPGEIKRVVVTAQNPYAGLVFLELEGLSYSLGHPIFFAVLDDATDVADTTPYYKYGYILEDENGAPFIIAQHFRQVIGNGKLKAMASNLIVVENDRIGPLEKGDGFLALVKVKIANTSNEVMTIERLFTRSGGAALDFTEEDMAVLGDKGLPFTIEPFSIVEGWIPFRVMDGRDGYGIVFYTNLGGFVLGHLQTYPIYPD